MDNFYDLKPAYAQKARGKTNHKVLQMEQIKMEYLAQRRRIERSKKKERY